MNAVTRPSRFGLTQRYSVEDIRQAMENNSGINGVEDLKIGERYLVHVESLLWEGDMVVYEGFFGGRHSFIEVDEEAMIALKCVEVKVRRNTHPTALVLKGITTDYLFLNPESKSRAKDLINWGRSVQ